MNIDFITIVITHPEFTACEAAAIELLLQSGAADYVHIRKPGCKAEAIGNLLKKINPNLYFRLRLHDHFNLVKEFSLGGIHLNSRNANYDEFPYACISASCHSLEEIKNRSYCNYVTLSPVFDSISKPGYERNSELIRQIEENSVFLPTKVVALGGVEPRNFHIIKKSGFSGMALLGYIWNDFNIDAFEDKVNEFLKFKNEIIN